MTTASYVGPTVGGGGGGGGGGAPSGPAGGGLNGTYPNPGVNGLSAGVLADDTAHGNRGGGALHAAATGATAGFMTTTQVTALAAATAAAAAAQADIDAFEATAGAASGLATLDSNSRLVQDVGFRRGAFVSVTTSQTLGTTQPLSLLDATMTGRTAGGSTTGDGVNGVVAFSFAASATETGGGAGQAGLGANSPLTDVAYAGVRIPVALRKVDGDDVQLADILLVPGSEPSAQVFGYLSYRSDLGADAHWRLWFYYVTSAGVTTAVTPTISLANVTVDVPEVFYAADVPLAADFGSGLLGGQRAAENAPGSLTTAMLADLAVTTAKIAAAAVDGTKVAGAGSTLTLGSSLSVGEALTFAGVISPAQLTANQTDYAPTGLSTAVVVRLSTDASRSVFSLGDNVAGRVKRIANVGSNPLVLVHDDGATGTAAMRFLVPGSVNLTLAANDSCWIQYDGTDSRWRVIGVLSRAAGTGAELQYRGANGQLAAAARATIDTENVTILTESSTTVPAALAGAAKLVSIRPSADFPSRLQVLSSSGGAPIEPFPDFTTRYYAAEYPASAALGWINANNDGSVPTFRTFADTDDYSRRYTIQVATSAVPGTSVRIKWGTLNYNRTTGFDAVFEDWSTQTVPATIRGFCGLNTAAIGNVEPDTLTNLIGVGFRSTDTVLHVIHNDGAGGATATSLGANFPVSATSRYRVRIYCASGGSTVYIYVRRLDAAFEATPTGLSSNIPAAATLLCPNIWINNASTAAVAGTEVAAITVMSRRRDAW